MKTLLISFLLLPIMLMPGCAGIDVTYVPLKPGGYLPTRQAKDILIVTGDLAEPYEALGIILIRKYPGSPEEEIQEEFRKEAMVRGADAVIQVQVEKQTVFSLSPFIFSLPFPGIEARGVAVKLKKAS